MQPIGTALSKVVPAGSSAAPQKTGTWKDLLSALMRSIDPEDFRTWFRPLRVRSEKDGTIVVVTPNDHFTNALEQSYRAGIDNAARALGIHEVRFVSQEAKTSSMSKEPSGFNPHYTFDAFVVGGSNEFAYAAARAVAENPGKTYNPLFFYSGVGLGKTHLLHAIGHEIQERYPHVRALYVASEQFVNELINSIRFDRMPAFRERYRTIDVLLLDDVQFIAGKERSQEEFFHTFNTLYTAGKQIVLTSDRPPRGIAGLEERLSSRFLWGLAVDVQSPELETKLAILRKKAEARNRELPDNVALFLANQARRNIRELEGFLHRVLAFSELTDRTLTLDLAEDCLHSILPEDGQRVSATDVIKFVAHHYGLKVAEIKSKGNQKQVSFPRQVAMWLCKRLTELSYPDIGRQFNDKHHSTVMYSVEKIDTLRESDAEFRQALDRMVEHFAN